MATGETGFSDVIFDLVSVQYHALKAGHDYGQYVRDAKNAGYDDVASFFEQVMQEDSQRASRCHDLMRELDQVLAPHSGPPQSAVRVCVCLQSEGQLMKGSCTCGSLTRSGGSTGAALRAGVTHGRRAPLL